MNEKSATALLQQLKTLQIQCTFRLCLSSISPGNIFFTDEIPLLPTTSEETLGWIIQNHTQACHL
jgi:hypothetical protein